MESTIKFYFQFLCVLEMFCFSGWFLDIMMKAQNKRATLIEAGKVLDSSVDDFEIMMSMDLSSSRISSII